MALCTARFVVGFVRYFYQYRNDMEIVKKKEKKKKKGALCIARFVVFISYFFSIYIEMIWKNV